MSQNNHLKEEYILRYQNDFQTQLTSKEFREAFNKLKNDHPIFIIYPSVDSLRELLRPNNKNYYHKDQVMTILLNELKQSNTIYPLIQIMFWDSLKKLYLKRKSRVADPMALFCEIIWSFFRCVIKHNLKRLPKKVDVNIFLNTKKKVIAWERKKIKSIETLCDEEILKVIENKYFEDNEFKDEQDCIPILADYEKSTYYPEEVEIYLLDKVYRGVITKTQYEIIIDTLVYKSMNMRVWAENNSVEYNTVRSLRYRAEVALREYMTEKNEES